MKNSSVYILVAIGIMLTIGAALTYLFRAQQSEAERHYSVVLSFEQSKTLSNDLHEEVLRSHAFISKNYDAIVSITNNLRETCPKFSDFGLWSPLNIKAYCDLVDQKVSAVESFKSRNSILKNSMDYLPELLEQLPAKSKLKAREIYSYLQRFSLEPNERMRAMILHEVSKIPLDGKGDALRLHAENILFSIGERSRLENQILGDKIDEELAKLESSYLQKYREQEERNGHLRALLFIFCVFLACSLMALFHRIQGMKNMLAAANSQLEDKVKIRTAELEQAITDLGQKQQMLAHSAKMSALGEMAGGVAHEINNPLAIISLRSEQLEECLRENDAPMELILESIALIRNTTARIAKIVSGLRTFSRDGSKLPTQEVSVGSILEDTLSFCQERFKSHGIDLRVLRDENFEEMVSCRPVEISQVVLNLLNNALDAVGALPEKWISLAVEKAGSTLRVIVTDSGSGIPENIRGKITQPFFTTKEIGKGTGLGLSISKGIIDAHGGSISLDSGCVNTRFVIILPSSAREIKMAA